MKATRRQHLRVTPTWGECLESRHLLSADAIISRTPEQVDVEIAALKTYFDAVMESGHNTFRNLSLLAGDNALHLYNLQFAVDGVLSMYEATGDREVLDYAIEYVTNVVDAAEVIEGGRWEADGYLDWELLAGDQPRPRREGAYLYDVQFASAMSRLARILHEDSALQTDGALQDFGDQLAQFVNEQVIDKWLNARSRRQWLEDYHDGNGFWIDSSTHTITVCYNLRQVLGDASHCNDIDRILAEKFKDLLVVQPDGSYLWEIWATYPNGHHHLAPDTAHENRVATMISRLAADSFVFDEVDLHHLAKTFTQRIWNGQTDWTSNPSIQDSPWFHNYVDGLDETYRNYTHFEDGTAGMNGFVYDGWIRLGEFDPETQLAGEALLDFVQAFSWNVNAIRQRNGSVFGKVMLSGHLARNLRFAEYYADPVEAVPRATIGLMPGDANSDGVVDFGDFLLLSHSFGKTDAVWAHGDFDGDAVVGFSDFLVLSAHFEVPRNVGA